MLWTRLPDSPEVCIKGRSACACPTRQFPRPQGPGRPKFSPSQRLHGQAAAYKCSLLQPRTSQSLLNADAAAWRLHAVRGIQLYYLAKLGKVETLRTGTGIPL